MTGAGPDDRLPAGAHLVRADSSPPRRTRAWLAAAVVFCAVAFDVSQPPERQWSARAAVGAVHLYQRVASPWMRTVGISCRFEPSCSRYAAASLERHGTLRGGWRSIVRIARCGPWTPSGTVDEP